MADEEKKSPETPEAKPADEQALSDTLMKELDTSEAKPAPEEPKSKFKLPLPFKKKVPSEPETDPTEQPATTEAKQLTNEALMEMIDERLDKLSGNEFIVIKISKVGLLIFVGVLLLALWAVPALHLLPTLPFRPKPSPQPTPTVEAAPTPAPVSIRIRMGKDSLDEANQLKSKLQTVGAATIDVVKDTSVNPKQVLIVTREGDESLRTQLAQLLTEQYIVSSESATLTEDSDFSATILVGQNSAR